MEHPVYRVRAVNTAADSENKIHDDAVAAQYGFRGGLVPGVTVYGYMTVPVVSHFSPAWLERGSMRVRFQAPFYEGDEVTVRTSTDSSGALNVEARQADGSLCATGVATLTARPKGPDPAHYSEHPLPNDRPEVLVAGAPLGTVTKVIEPCDSNTRQLLQFSNEILVRNFKLGPWIHVASDLTNFSEARVGEVVSARGRVDEVFERKGHEFVVLDIILVAGAQVVQQVRHTAIYRLRAR